ncbi:MAG: hypothetical protein E7J35_00555 [Veillonella sp.]|uniref:hypothetical protein n=1 Tax=Veillonella TaxID=29465 RepID=UPI002069F418|nr:MULTISPECIES: hypothetical protein [Veillonella]DAP61568.1 MAG TPA: hypothetical protein [Caudoviricetes sp.]MDU4110760.1 hypothetical protein [Veillonella parvula]MDU4115272.1 hypothetical protein [Veillonella sp.]MDU4140189.1 hypothetical protein [Veillonella parvula]MDU7910155.1 hypothetical protein [Veillonella parvula]
MPNLVLEKGSQTHRFKLHEDKSVTRGKYISVPFNGKEYYARYGDASTPLKIEKDGRTYSIQYDPIEFVSFSWSRNGRGNGKYKENVFLPKGQYRVTYTQNITGTNTTSDTFAINTSQEAPVTIEYNQEGVIHRIWVTIPGVYNGYQRRLYGDITFIIERIGE